MGPRANTKVPYGPIILQKKSPSSSRRLFQEEEGDFLEDNRALRDLCRGPRAHRVALRGLLRRHKGCPRGHLRCELWVLISDSSL